MADTFGLSKAGIQRTAETNRRVLGRSEVGRRTRRVTWPEDANGGDGTGCIGCAGCNCTDCLELCESLNEDVILDCVSCADGAFKHYRFSVGYWAEYSGLGDDPATGYTQVAYDAGCEWKSEVVFGGGGVYQWTLTQAAGSSTIQLWYVSGTDGLDLGTVGTPGANEVKFVFAENTATWSCRCSMQMKISDVNKAPLPGGLNCSICLIPFPSTANTTCPLVDGIVPCIPTFDFPQITWGTAYSDDFPVGFDGTTAVEVPMERNLGSIDETCPWVGSVILLEAVAAIDDTVITVNINYNTGVVDLYCQPGDGFGGPSAQYSLATPWVIGANVLNFVTDYGDADADWPATITVTLTDCTFLGTHPELCGEGPSTDGDCGGFGCQYTAYDSTGTQGGAIGPWTWGGCEAGACPDGCSAPGPPVDPPTSGGDTYSVVCA